MVVLMFMGLLLLLVLVLLMMMMNARGRSFTDIHVDIDAEMLVLVLVLVLVLLLSLGLHLPRDVLLLMLRPIPSARHLRLQRHVHDDRPRRLGLCLFQLSRRIYRFPRQTHVHPHLMCVRVLGVKHAELMLMLMLMLLLMMLVQRPSGLMLLLIHDPILPILNLVVHLRRLAIQPLLFEL